MRLIETLNFLENSGIIIKGLVTDRHSQIRKYLRENKPQINHQFDIWHMAKYLKKKLSNFGKKKDCNLNKASIKFIINISGGCVQRVMVLLTF